MGKRSHKPKPWKPRGQNIPKAKRKPLRKPRTKKLSTAIAWDMNELRKISSWSKYKNGYNSIGLKYLKFVAVMGFVPNPPLGGGVSLRL